MPRRKSTNKAHVNLADLVLRNLRHQPHHLRHHNLRPHPYNLRKSTLQRAAGSMNEAVLWKKQLQKAAAQAPLRSSSTMTSGSRLHLAAVDIPKDGLKTPPHGSNTAGTQTQLKQSPIAPPVVALSTVVLHRNPHFDVDGKRRSGLLSVKKRPVEDRVSTRLIKKTASPKKPKVDGGSDGSSISSEAPSGSTATENSKTETEESNSFDGNVDHAEIEVEVEAETQATTTASKDGAAQSGERKDQELSPPPAQPTEPHVQRACSRNCLTLHQILESVDNYLKTVTEEAML